MNKPSFMRLDTAIQQRLLPLALRLYKNKYLLAIRHTFYMVMPFLLTVSLLDIIESIFLDPWGLVMGSQGLNLGFWLTGGLSGDAYRYSPAVEAMATCRQVVNVGYGIISIMLTTSLASRLAAIWQIDRTLTVFCALGAFLFMLPLPASTGGAMADYFSERRFVSAFVIAFAASWLFCRLSKVKWLKLSVPVFMPEIMVHYLRATLPIGVTLMFFALLSVFLEIIKMPGEALLLDIIPSYLAQNPVFVLVYQFFVWTLWWLGFPGYSFTSFIQKGAYVPAQISNQLGDTVAVFTSGFFEAGLVHVLGLIIAVLVFSRHETWRRIAKFSLPPMMFNVQEPIIFGLPVALNPIFFLPYILAPLANTLVGFAAVEWGIVPVFKASVPWTMPIFLAATIGTNSFMGGVLQIVWLIMDIFIYAPFVIMANMLDLTSEQEDDGNEGGGET